MKSNIEGTNIIKAKQLMDDVIVQLNEQKKKVHGTSYSLVNVKCYFHCNCC